MASGCTKTWATAPILLRYNTGLHISVNGRTLAGILDLLHDQWPVPITELVLVGHSMGGLVARSACHYGHRAGRRARLPGAAWPSGDASWAWGSKPHAVFEARSDLDLRYGACLDDDWRDADPDEFLRDRCREAPFLPHATYHFVSSTVAPPLLGMLAGDHLVRPKSAAGLGRSRRIPFAQEHGLILTGLNHFDLLNHPLIYAKLHHWLSQSAICSAGIDDVGRDVSGDR